MTHTPQPGSLPERHEDAPRAPIVDKNGYWVRLIPKGTKPGPRPLPSPFHRKARKAD